LSEASEAKARHDNWWREKIRTISIAELVKHSRTFVRDVEAGRRAISTAKRYHDEYLAAVRHRIDRGETITDEQGADLLEDTRKLERLYRRFQEGR